MRDTPYGKRGQLLVGVLVIVIVLIAIAWLVSVAKRECGSNADCGTNQYCGSDDACHDMPIITETVYRNSLLGPAFIIGIAIIIGFWIHARLGRDQPPQGRVPPTEPRRSRLPMRK
ncbi:hypothetical protein JXB02_04595 [Candidatus Woesearchaeota archaeon]|nr:hypothetical protein [Candidatus Woesearchaeota archaeon]